MTSFSVMLGNVCYCLLFTILFSSSLFGFSYFKVYSILFYFDLLEIFFAGVNWVMVYKQVILDSLGSLSICIFFPSVTLKSKA